ncbi:riboflavin synthase (alpha subunit) [Streptococcus infantarius subsp. infantarius]|nr:riboflavin synthase (alpha subunit) [Streptococcus infantarius subsp. infantarius]MCO4638233.1 riboflavin synthase (alpha subunit) [Streptococcus infantarius subsp. infantarius]MCO4641595.1 riboflavin synthase (alpha subunit) [Streptococcus infantarius subsp. infantarius]MCO4644081.1 riboflavin synthase (alpha subunit) [Streptococcus infantarius subsp. infantarius]MCO4651122.1 riboflavin synthase (alpha subunit) [Streptococcus infantarius subsp. infantarius]
MFTGLIQEQGLISRMVKHQHNIKLTCKASRKLLADYKIGDSMAINGVCLTCVAKAGDMFTVDIIPETFRRTMFSTCRIGDLVNLELAMSANARFEGHLVTGHVDGVATLVQKKSDETALVLSFAFPKELERQIVAQGSIAVNGVSLTVVSVEPGQFSVSLIPHTAKETNLASLKKGDKVNIETDILAKDMQAQVSKMKGE